MDGPRLKHANTNDGLEQTVSIQVVNIISLVADRHKFDPIDTIGQTHQNIERCEQALGKKEEVPQGLEPIYKKEATFGILEDFEEDGEYLEATHPDEKYAAFDFVKEKQEDS